MKILALGDSLTAGYGLPPGQSFVDRLQGVLADIDPSVSVIQGGKSGDTTAGGLARLDWMLGTGPDAVILELGANDGLRGIDPATTRANLEAILDTLAERGLPVLLCGMYAPPNMGPAYGAEFRAVFEDLAADRDLLFYPFFLDGVAGDTALNQDDGIHPTEAGIGIIVENILPQVKELIEQARTQADVLED